MSLASGVPLKPINLSLVKIPGSNNSKPKYVAPNKRNIDTTKIESVEMSEQNFPSLGVPTLESIVDNSKKNGFKQTILNLIAKDTMDEIEREIQRNKKPEVDLMKMSPSELNANGFTILKLNAKESIERINSMVYS